MKHPVWSVVVGWLACTASAVAAQPAPDRVVVDAAACPELDIDRAELRRLVAVELAADGVSQVAASGDGARISVLPTPCTPDSTRFDLVVEGDTVRRASLGSLGEGARVRGLALAIAESLRTRWAPSPPEAPAPAAPAPEGHRERLPNLARASWALRPSVRALTGTQTMWGGTAELEVPVWLGGQLRAVLGVGAHVGSSDTSLGSLTTLWAGMRAGAALVTATHPFALEAALVLEAGGVHLFATASAPGALGLDRTGWTAAAVGELGTRWWIGSAWFVAARAQAGLVLRHFVGVEEGQAVGGVDGAILGASLAVGSSL